MPVESVEEAEHVLEGFIGNLEAGMVALDGVFFEDAAVEVGNVADELFEIGGALILRCAETFMKEPTKEAL